MCDDEKHIIDWILDSTDNSRQKALFSSRKKSIRREHKKIPLDDQIKYCKECKCCWMTITRYMTNSKYIKYPKGHMPSIGKKRELCRICKGEINENS